MIGQQKYILPTNGDHLPDLGQWTVFDILKLSLVYVVRLRGHKLRKLNDHVYSFLCLCPFGPTIQLNFNISKVTY